MDYSIRKQTLEYCERVSYLTIAIDFYKKPTTTGNQPVATEQTQIRSPQLLPAEVNWGQACDLAIRGYHALLARRLVARLWGVPVKEIVTHHFCIRLGRT